MENLTTLQTFGQEKLAALKNISIEPGYWRTIGFVAIAATTGAVTGVIVAKGLLAAKGAVAAQAALAANGGTAAAPSIVLNSTTELVTTVTTGGAALGHQLAVLFNALTTNALPLTAGAVGGGAVGVGVTQRQVRHLQVRFNEQIAQMEAYQAEANRLQTALADAETQISANAAKITLPVAQPAQDQLEQIRGIGPVFARHLNAAGIFTFADLAAQTPEQLQQIMAGARANRMFHPQEWIDQARQLATGSGKVLTPSITPERSQIAPTGAIMLDRLEAIAGLTPDYASRLNAAGVLTYADLAAQTPARVQQICNATEDVATVQAWLAAAEALRR